MLAFQDRRDSAQGHKAHGLTVGDDQDQWLGWPPGVRYPLDEPEVVPVGRVGAITDSMLQVRGED
jgi:hypothetical protein